MQGGVSVKACKEVFERERRAKRIKVLRREKENRKTNISYKLCDAINWGVLKHPVKRVVNGERLTPCVFAVGNKLPSLDFSFWLQLRIRPPLIISWPFLGN